MVEICSSTEMFFYLIVEAPIRYLLYDLSFFECTVYNRKILHCVACFQATVCSWLQLMSLVMPLAWSTLRTPEHWWPPFILSLKTSDFLRMTSKASRSSMVRWNVIHGLFPRQGLSLIQESKQERKDECVLSTVCNYSVIYRYANRQTSASNTGTRHSHGHLQRASCLWCCSTDQRRDFLLQGQVIK